MEVNSRFVRAGKDSMSAIRARYIMLYTPLNPIKVLEIAREVNASFATKVVIYGADERNLTLIEIDLENAATKWFAKFQYEIMNWEGNTYHHNKPKIAPIINGS